MTAWKTVFLYLGSSHSSEQGADMGVAAHGILSRQGCLPGQSEQQASFIFSGPSVDHFLESQPDGSAHPMIREETLFLELVFV